MRRCVSTNILLKNPELKAKIGDESRHRVEIDDNQKELRNEFVIRIPSYIPLKQCKDKMRNKC